MTESTMNFVPRSPKHELLRGIVAAAAVAGVALTVAILPAEYGIDPTGAGKVLGLTALYQPAAAEAATAAPATTAPARKGSTVSAPGEERADTVSARQATGYRVDTMEVTLPPGKGLEVKTHLAKGATLIYEWKTANGEVLNHDFHGEPVNAKPNEFESFIEDKGISESRGSLVAPFTGLHGWYWKNKSAAPVTLVLKASGFYSDIYKK